MIEKIDRIIYKNNIDKLNEVIDFLNNLNIETIDTSLFVTKEELEDYISINNSTSKAINVPESTLNSYYMPGFIYGRNSENQSVLPFPHTDGNNYCGLVLSSKTDSDNNQFTNVVSPEYYAAVAHMIIVDNSSGPTRKLNALPAIRGYYRSRDNWIRPLLMSTNPDAVKMYRGPAQSGWSIQDYQGIYHDESRGIDWYYNEYTSNNNYWNTQPNLTTNTPVIGNGEKITLEMACALLLEDAQPTGNIYVGEFVCNNGRLEENTGLWFRQNNGENNTWTNWDKVMLHSAIGNEANKIPVYSSEGHLVLPDGTEIYGTDLI